MRALKSARMRAGKLMHVSKGMQQHGAQADAQRGQQRQLHEDVGPVALSEHAKQQPDHAPAARKPGI